jgi:hypothetical protein
MPSQKLPHHIDWSTWAEEDEEEAAAEEEEEDEDE